MYFDQIFEKIVFNCVWFENGKTAGKYILNFLKKFLIYKTGRKYIYFLEANQIVLLFYDMTSWYEKDFHFLNQFI